MKLVYIASPYHAGTLEKMEKNRLAALAACENAYRLGRNTGETVLPITPIGNFPYLKENEPVDREQALRFGAALLSKCDELWVAGDHISEGMRGEICAAVRMHKPVLSMGMDQAFIQDVASDLRPMLEQSVCDKYSVDKDYTDKLLVLKIDELAPWALAPENQLWVARFGFGCRPSARGRAVYAENLFDGENARFDRSDFYGIAIESRLPNWARDKLAEYRQQENSDDESEEMEQ